MTTNNKDIFYDVLSSRLVEEYENGMLGADAYHEAMFQIIAKMLEKNEVQSALRTVCLLDRQYLTGEHFLTLASEDDLMFNALKNAAVYFPSERVVDADEINMPAFVQGNNGLLS